MKPSVEQLHRTSRAMGAGMRELDRSARLDATLGHPDGQTLIVPSRTNYVYARVDTPTGLVVREVLCTKTMPQYGLPVRLRKNDYGWWESFEEHPIRAPIFHNGALTANVGRHAGYHWYLAADPALIHSLQLYPYQVYPADTPSLTVNVRGYLYFWNDTWVWLDDTTHDLTSKVPSTTMRHRLVILGIDRDTSALTTLDGSETLYYGDDNPFDEDDIVTLLNTAGDDFLPGPAIWLKNGQTQITRQHIFFDCKGLAERGRSRKHNMTATAAPTVNDDSGDGYSVGSRWLDVTNDVEYVCLDATAAAAVWRQTTGSLMTSAASAPTVDDDSGDGYSVGSRWIDTSTDLEYVCLDASVGAAVWKPTTGLDLMPVTNSSGAAASKGDAGYLDATGDYQTTTTANDMCGSEWCVVVDGGADAAAIKVTRRGVVNISYTGTAPSAGDYLVTSTTAGKAQASSVMRPEVFAVALAAGSGGTVEALLLAMRSDVEMVDDDFVLTAWGRSNTATTMWTGTVNDAAPTSSPVTVSTSTGNIDMITPLNNDDWFGVVIYNLTQGNEAVVKSVSGNDVTFFDDTPLGSWTNGDSLTAQTDAHAQSYLTYAMDTSDRRVPALTTEIRFLCTITDSGAANQSLKWHPYDSFSATKQLVFTSQVANVYFRALGFVQLIDDKFTVQNDGSAAGTFYYSWKVSGYRVAVP